MVGLPVGSSLTLDTSVYTIPKFDYTADKGTASVVFDVKPTLSSENGLFELEMCKPGECGFPLFAAFISKSTCDLNKPYQSSISYQFVDEIGKTQRITITNTGIPDGDYYPILVHVNQCCAAGSCFDKQPFGWGYSLTSGKITFKSQQVCTSVCVPLYILSNNCALNSCGSGCGADNINTFSTEPECKAKLGTSQTQIDFKLSNIKHVRSGDLTLTQALTAYNVFGVALPIGLKVETLRDGQLVSIDITNIGTQASGATIEAFFISANNQFLSNGLVALGSASSVPFLQSFLGRAGIEATAGTTCKLETGARYSIDVIQPSVTKTLWIYVPYPKQGDKLAGNDNYHPEKQYLLLINLVDACKGESTIIYDVIGATVNGFRVASNQVPAGGVVPCGKECEVGINDTSVNINERQKTIKRNDIQFTTSTDLAKSICSTDDVCDSKAKCVPISALIESGDVPESLAKKDLSEIYSNVAKIGGIVGGTIGGAGVGVALAGAIPTICASSLTTGIFAIPICLTATTLGGAYLGGSLGSSISTLFKDLGDGNTNSVGYCVPKEEAVGGGKFTDFLEGIGKSLNDAFGGKSKTKLTDIQMGYILLGVIAFFIIIAFTRK